MQGGRVKQPPFPRVPAIRGDVVFPVVTLETPIALPSPPPRPHGNGFLTSSSNSTSSPPWAATIRATNRPPFAGLSTLTHRPTNRAQSTRGSERTIPRRRDLQDVSLAEHLRAVEPCLDRPRRSRAIVHRNPAAVSGDRFEPRRADGIWYPDCPAGNSTRSKPNAVSSSNIRCSRSPFTWYDRRELRKQKMWGTSPTFSPRGRPPRRNENLLGWT